MCSSTLGSTYMDKTQNFHCHLEACLGSWCLYCLFVLSLHLTPPDLPCFRPPVRWHRLSGDCPWILGRMYGKSHMQHLWVLEKSLHWKCRGWGPKWDEGWEQTASLGGGTSLVVQWLGLCAPNPGGPGWIPGQGTRSYNLEFVYHN